METGGDLAKDGNWDTTKFDQKNLSTCFLLGLKWKIISQFKFGLEK